MKSGAKRMNEAMARSIKSVRFNPLNYLSYEMWQRGFEAGWRAAQRSKEAQPKHGGTK